MTPESIASSLAALVAVLAFILFGGRIARLTRSGRKPQGAGGHLALVDTLNLDPRRRLVLVRSEGRHVLVLTGQQDQVIGWMPEALR